MVVEMSKRTSSVTGKKSLRQRLADFDEEFVKLLESEDPEIFQGSDNDIVDDEVGTSEDEAQTEENVEEPTGGDDNVEELTNRTLDKIKLGIQTGAKLSNIKMLIGAFAACAVKTGVSLKKISVPYVVNDLTVLNNCVRLCFTHFPNLWCRCCGFEEFEKSMTQRPIWRRLFPAIKMYLRTIVKLLSELKSEDVISSTIAHIVQLSQFYTLIPVTSKVLLKKLIVVWSEKNLECRRASHEAIIILLKSLPPDFNEGLIKNLYLSFVRNSKIVSEESQEKVNIMQDTLVVICSMNQQAVYRHAFVFIRQLAISLRNAVINQSNNTVKLVHSWPFVQSVVLWCKVLSTYPNEVLFHSLRYPLLQVAFGCVRLRKSQKSLPFLFRLCNAMMDLQESTKIFIPVHSIAIEALQSINFNQRPKRQTLKPIDFDACLKLTSSQLEEFSFRPKALEKFVETILRFFYIQAYSAAFPEIAWPVVQRLKSFCKQCRNVNFTKSVKDVRVLLQQHSAWIVNQRARGNGSNPAADGSVSTDEKGPLHIYYERYEKVKLRQRLVIQQLTTEQLPREGKKKVNKISKKRSKSKHSEDVPDQVGDEIVDFRMSDSD